MESRRPSSFHWTVRFASDVSLLCELEGEIDQTLATREILKVTARLRRHSELRAEIRNYHPAYRSLLLDFESDDPVGALGHVKSLVERPSAETREDENLARPREIPVRFGGEQGPDLAWAAAQSKLSVDEFVAAYTSVDYTVAFLGFSPGFPYLNGLPQQLACTRLETPRTRVPAGSVAIGGFQTGIYPSSSAGGWRIIGRTDLRLFNIESETPAFLEPGDRVRFVCEGVAP